VGFAAEAGWKAMKGDEWEEGDIPSFDYVRDMLLNRLKIIAVGCRSEHGQRTIFLTEGKTFRDEIAVTKPYKGTRETHKPWHYNNISVYLRDVLGAVTVTGIEADDAMAIAQVASDGNSVICSRDKDLRQVPGWVYSWELGKQPSFGPHLVTQEGTLELNDKKKIKATGLASFYAQLLTGDTVDNIPGLKGVGPVAAFEALVKCGVGEELDVVRDMYGNDELLLEQGRLLWMCRRLYPENGCGEMWEIGMEK